MKGPLSVAVDNTELIKHNSDVINEIGIKKLSGVETTLIDAYSMLNADLLTDEQKKQVANMYGMTATELRQRFASYKRSDTLHTALGCVPKNEYEFVDAQMLKWDVVMNFQKFYFLRNAYQYAGVIIDEAEFKEYDYKMQVKIQALDPKKIVFGDILAKLIKVNSILKLNYSTEKITRALEYWTTEKQNEIIAQVKGDVIFNKNLVEKADLEWNKFIDAITDVNVPESKVVMKHFIWQIKRKMFDKPVFEHMMPVLSGLQGIGKSSVVKQLLKPIHEFTTLTHFSDITDNRSHELWKNYVLILDEMGNSTQSNIEEIKKKITADSFSGRIMKTNTNTSIINYSTMIGTTNKDLTRLIFDETGMRRFFQIECKNKFDWDITSNIDYLLLWQSIDENANTELLLHKDILDNIHKQQDEIRFKTSIELFFEERDYPKNAETFRALDLFKEYQKYELEHLPRGEMTSGKFFRDIKDIPKRIPDLVIEKLPRDGKGIRYRITKKSV